MSDMKRHGLIMVGILVTVIALNLIFPSFFHGLGDRLAAALEGVRSWRNNG
ncbi:hypothetical protein ABAC460_16200 [Asticcacaulis sp. AC460]|uniref:hypothetical protein n=1 Tax=Asticcacaulis sp. AC460 TaxID=1282360 RepID=UPI0003C3DAAF|nr:hypothetical protein [Asticcacaulis sp. AC460]ESQ88202.1 hypothetical protein ABAC460_16200 [Asticcacaulis sp. AC460]